MCLISAIQEQKKINMEMVMEKKKMKKMENTFSVFHNGSLNSKVFTVLFSSSMRF